MVAAHRSPGAYRDEREQAEHEEVRGHGKDSSGSRMPRRFPNIRTTTNAERHLNPVDVPFGKRGRDGRHASGDADRDGQHVVDQQRRRRDEAGVSPMLSFATM